MEAVNPNDLVIFARVADTGSFSRAAERLGLPKSTVSRRITLLEDQLGERLMIRTTRKLRFTEFGLQLLEHARQVSAEVDAVDDLREHRQSQPTGRLRISMPSEMANLLLHNVLATFSERYPAVKIELDLSPRRVDLLGEGFDVALRMGDLPDDATLAARHLATISNGLYAAPSYLEQFGVPQHPDDLLQHQGLLILRRNNTSLPWTLLDGETRWEGAPPSSFCANSPELLVRMACAGRGIVAAPDSFAHHRVLNGELRRVLTHWFLPPVSAWAVFAGRRLMPTRTRAFIDLLQTAMSTISI